MSMTIRGMILLLWVVTANWIALMLHIYSPEKNLKDGVAQTKQKSVCPSGAQMEAL